MPDSLLNPAYVDPVADRPRGRPDSRTTQAVAAWVEIFEGAAPPVSLAALAARFGLTRATLRDALAVRGVPTVPPVPSTASDLGALS